MCLGSSLSARGPASSFEFLQYSPIIESIYRPLFTLAHTLQILTLVSISILSVSDLIRMPRQTPKLLVQSMQTCQFALPNDRVFRADCKATSLSAFAPNERDDCWSWQEGKQQGHLPGHAQEWKKHKGLTGISFALYEGGEEKGFVALSMLLEIGTDRKHCSIVRRIVFLIIVFEL